MAFGVDDALALGGGITSGIAGSGQDHFSAQQQRNADLRSMLMQMYQFQRQQGLAEGNAASQFQRQIEQAPMRDQLYYNLAARMGLPQQSLSYNNSGFTPVSQANTNPAAQYNSAVSNYRPGMGGVDMSQSIQHQMLNNLGYGNGPNNGRTLYNPQQAQGKYTENWIVDFLTNGLGGGKPDTYKPGAPALGNGAPTYGAAPATPAPVAPKPTQGYGPGGINPNAGLPFNVPKKK